MSDQNIIKSKKLHVQEQFYQQLINGFSNDEQQKTANKRQKMQSNQSKKFKSKVLPIILKQAQKKQLIYNYYSTVYQEKKNKFLDNIQSNFIKSYVELDQIQQEIQNEIQYKQNQRKDVLDKVTSFGKKYRQIKKLLIKVKSFTFLINQVLEIKNKGNLKNFQNYYNKRDVQDKINTYVYDTKGVLQSSIMSFLFPVFQDFYETISDKLGSFWIQVLTGIVKSVLLPDTEDPIDTALWGLSVGSTIVSIATFGGTSEVSASIWAMRISRALNKIKPLTAALRHLKGGFTRSFRSVMTIARGSRIGKGFTTYRTFMNTGRKANFFKGSLAVISASRGYYKKSRIAVNGIDWYFTDQDDVKEMEDAFRAKTSKKGRKVISKLTKKLENFQMGAQSMIQDVQFMKEVIKQANADLTNSVNKLISSGGVLKKYEDLYQISIRIKGLQNAVYFKTLKRLKTRIAKNLVQNLNEKIKNTLVIDKINITSEKKKIKIQQVGNKLKVSRKMFDLQVYSGEGYYDRWFSVKPKNMIKHNGKYYQNFILSHKDIKLTNNFFYKIAGGMKLEKSSTSVNFYKEMVKFLSQEQFADWEKWNAINWNERRITNLLKNGTAPAIYKNIKETEIIGGVRNQIVQFALNQHGSLSSQEQNEILSHPWETINKMLEWQTTTGKVFVQNSSDVTTNGEIKWKQDQNYPLQEYKIPWRGQAMCDLWNFITMSFIVSVIKKRNPHIPLNSYAQNDAYASQSDYFTSLKKSSDWLGFDATTGMIKGFNIYVPDWFVQIVPEKAYGQMKHSNSLRSYKISRDSIKSRILIGNQENLDPAAFDEVVSVKKRGERFILNFEIYNLYYKEDDTLYDLGNQVIQMEKAIINHSTELLDRQKKFQKTLEEMKGNSSKIQGTVKEYIRKTL